MLRLAALVLVAALWPVSGVRSAGTMAVMTYYVERGPAYWTGEPVQPGDAACSSWLALRYVRIVAAGITVHCVDWGNYQHFESQTAIDVATVGGPRPVWIEDVMEIDVWP